MGSSVRLLDVAGEEVSLAMVEPALEEVELEEDDNDKEVMG